VGVNAAKKIDETMSYNRGCGSESRSTVLWKKMDWKREGTRKRMTFKELEAETTKQRKQWKHIDHHKETRSGSEFESMIF